MSGGVDSAVSAALLKEEGFDVTGVFIRVWQPDWITCAWREERLEAMRAAAHLGIPFLTLNLERQYKRDVIDYMTAEYGSGRTPNPDVMCNRTIKFGAFWDWARERGADYIATGHYARVARDDGYLKLLAGTDKSKDQSYFLWTLRQADLRHILLPVGGMIKSEVRSLAKRLGLPNAEKKDSQGLCFIGKMNVKEFLSHSIETVPGIVLDQSGENIGAHPGASLFTIGERHGFVIDAKHKSPSDEPYYVIDKDIWQNTLTVSNRGAAGALPLAQKKVRVSGLNWHRGSIPEATDDAEAFPFRARHRYRQPLEKIRVSRAAITETIFEFERPQDTITPGQSLVIYDGEECLGGGIIED